jgi:hypothetical protein
MVQDIWLPEDINDTQREIIVRMVSVYTTLQRKRSRRPWLSTLYKQMTDEIQLNMFTEGTDKIDDKDKYIEEADRIYKKYIELYKKIRKGKDVEAKGGESNEGEGAEANEGEGGEANKAKGGEANEGEGVEANEGEEGEEGEANEGEEGEEGEADEADEGEGGEEGEADEADEGEGGEEGEADEADEAEGSKVDQAGGSRRTRGITKRKKRSSLGLRKKKKIQPVQVANSFKYYTRNDDTMLQICTRYNIDRKLIKDMNPQFHINKKFYAGTAVILPPEAKVFIQKESVGQMHEKKMRAISMRESSTHQSSTPQSSTRQSSIDGNEGLRMLWDASLTLWGKDSQVGSGGGGPGKNEDFTSILHELESQFLATFSKHGITADDITSETSIGKWSFDKVGNLLQANRDFLQKIESWYDVT